MTDVTGSMFISYRRSPGRHSGDADALLVRDALRDRGVPTWRDLDDLNPVPTEDALVETLSSEEIAGAVLLVSPEMQESQMVCVVEAPAILDRFNRRDGFVLKPVLINIAYHDVDRVLGQRGAFQKIGRFNLDRIEKESLDSEDARRIAKAVLKQRIAAVRLRDPTRTFSVGLYSRRSSSADGYTLRHDVTPYFDGRDATPGAYARIENALYDAATALAATGEKIAIIACGNASLPLGVLFGAVYSPFVFDLAWKQAAPGAPEETWSLMCGVAHVGTTVRHTKENLNSAGLGTCCFDQRRCRACSSAEYLAVADFAPRAMISVGLANGPLQRGRTISPQQGLKIVYDAIDAARNLKRRASDEPCESTSVLGLPPELGGFDWPEPQYLRRVRRLRAFQRPNAVLCTSVHRFNPSNFTYQDC